MKKIALGIIVKENSVLIVKRKKNEGDLLWQFPGGEVEENETSTQAIIREIKEETGLNCCVLECIGSRIHPYTNREMSYWACKYISGEISIHDDDLNEVLWVQIQELKKYFTTEIYDSVLKYLNLK